VSLTTREIHRNRDRLFTLRRGKKNTKYRGAKFVDGVAEPVKYKDARRLKAAQGKALTVTFYEPPKPARKPRAKKVPVKVASDPTASVPRETFTTKPEPAARPEPLKADVETED